MTTIGTYAQLQSVMADWLNRTDLTAVIPTFIELCEARIRRIIRTRNTGIQTILTVAGQGTISIPTGIIEVRELVLDDSANGNGGAIEIVSLSEVIKRRAMQGSVTARPFMANIADTTVTLAPIPDAVYTIYATVEGPFVPLSGSNATNWIIVNYPDVYLYGSLAESAPYLKDEDRLPMWENRFQMALNELSIAKERAEWPSTPVQKLDRAYS